MYSDIETNNEFALKHSQSQDFTKLSRILGETHICMMTTQCENKKFRSRPMHVREIDEDGSIWFLNHLHSAKAEEIRDDQHVNLSFANPAMGQFASISGNATVLNDKEKLQQLFSEKHKQWFPNGMEDKELSAIKVIPTAAEFWDGEFNQKVDTGSKLDSESKLPSRSTSIELESISSESTSSA